MSEKRLLRNNRGASLVLVLVAMLFVGIIGGIVLTLTVGNSKSTKNTVDSSENFYTTESALDDFQMYIKKIATSAATQAYAETLESGTITEQNFNYQFKKQFYNVMKESADSILNKYGEEEAGKINIDPDFIINQISAGRSDVINIKLGEIQWNYDPNESAEGVKEANINNTNPIVLKNVEITLLDDKGSENKITCDVAINVNIPKTEWEDTSGEFNYDIDHYVMIAGGNIDSGAYQMAGNITGSIYTYSDLNIKTKTPKTDPSCIDSDRVNIKADAVVVGGDINVRGRLDIAPINDTSVSPTRQKKEKSESGEETTRNVGVEVWCESVKLSSIDSEVTIEKETDLNTELYFRNSIELNGKLAKFIAACDRIYGYSGKDAAATYNGSSNLLSSAIVLNGLGATLDLSASSDLKIAGTAYTALPSLEGVDPLYNYYNGEGTVDEPTDLSYYTQGESITYRALQSLYLVPGDFIKGIGHNPMKYSEYQSILKTIKNSDNTETTVLNEAYIDLAKAKDYIGKVGGSGDDEYLLKDTPVKAHIVRYMGGADSYVYIFWNFESPDKAVKYFNKITASNKKYEGLFGKQTNILKDNSGTIKLPAESNVKTAGNAIVYKTTTTDGTTTSKFDTYGSKSVSLSKYEDKYKGMKSELNENVTIQASLINSMFENKFNTNHLANKKYQDILYFGPLTSYDKDEKTQVTYKLADDCNYNPNTKYYLITGPNVQLGGLSAVHDDDPSWNVIKSIKTRDGKDVQGASLSDYSYIIITPGNVELQISGNFRGMIIAGGTITVGPNLNMECLGMLTRIPSDTGEAKPISEFKALLDIKTGVTEATPLEPDYPNNRLEAIFNVFENGGKVGGNEFVDVNIAEFLRN